MRKLMLVIVTAVTVGLILGTEAVAQKGIMWRGGGGWGHGTPYGRMYNPQTVETIGGEVVSVDRIIPLKGMAYGIHVTLKTDKETIPIHLGPGWYMENQDVKITRTDKIEVKGSRITLEGKPAIIASEIRKGEDVLVLRDANGFPVWSGWRRR
jgi:hypothetical protein